MEENTKKLSSLMVSVIEKKLEVDNQRPDKVKKMLSELEYTGESVTLFRGIKEGHKDEEDNEEMFEQSHFRTKYEFRIKEAPSAPPVYFRIKGEDNAYVLPDSARQINGQKGTKFLMKSYSKAPAIALGKFSEGNLITMKGRLNCTVYYFKYKIWRNGAEEPEQLISPDEYCYIEIPLNRIFDAEYIGNVMYEQFKLMLEYNNLSLSDIEDFDVDENNYNFESLGYCIDVSAIPREEYNEYLESIGMKKLKFRAAYDGIDHEVISTFDYKEDNGKVHLVFKEEGAGFTVEKKPLTFHVLENKLAVSYLRHCCFKDSYTYNIDRAIEGYKDFQKSLIERLEISDVDKKKLQYIELSEAEKEVLRLICDHYWDGKDVVYLID